MKLKTINEPVLKNKKVLLRLDLNTPLKNGKVADATRIKAAIPTIKYILKKNPKQLIIISHLGRPQGLWLNRLTLKPVAKELEKRLKRNILFFPQNIKDTKELPDDKIVMLENIRFYPEEEKNNKVFAKKIAGFAQVYINDAFGTCHRKHVSVHAITNFLPSYAGLLVEKETTALAKLFHPKRPFIALIGGGKADKVRTIKKMIDQADLVLTAGTCAMLIAKARGNDIEISTTPQLWKIAKHLAKEHNVITPQDILSAKRPDKTPKKSQIHNIPKDHAMVDIGPETKKQYIKLLNKAKTIFWGGPVGYIEYKNTAKSTMAIAKTLAQTRAYTVIGGGDSAYAATMAKVQNQINHISTGGGASMMFVEDHTLPALEQLRKKR